MLTPTLVGAEDRHCIALIFPIIVRPCQYRNPAGGVLYIHHRFPMFSTLFPKGKPLECSNLFPNPMVAPSQILRRPGIIYRDLPQHRLPRFPPRPGVPYIIPPVHLRRPPPGSSGQVSIQRERCQPLLAPFPVDKAQNRYLGDLQPAASRRQGLEPVFRRRRLFGLPGILRL